LAHSVAVAAEEGRGAAAAEAADSLASAMEQVEPELVALTTLGIKAWS
jgi:hypothetical protein